MPIIHMASSYSEAVEKGTNVRLYHDCYLHTTIQRFSSNEICQNLNPQIPLDEQPTNGYEYSPLLYLYDTHVGVCISDYERNGYDDSDWYMIVWNEEKHQPETIEFASTRGWSYPCYASRPDATPEVLAKYEAYKKREREAYERAIAAERARKPAKGKTLKVVRGRKVPIGTTGECIWVGSQRFGRTVTERVGIKTESGEVHWTAMSNVEVVLAS